MRAELGEGVAVAHAAGVFARGDTEALAQAAFDAGELSRILDRDSHGSSPL